MTHSSKLQFSLNDDASHDILLNSSSGTDARDATYVFVQQVLM